ncbi:hypothetical protein [Kribbella sp. NPDC048915]|uniref:hypothetical protein n=1 Tax=Kribbella sp. NPDC048915 TaxID=3155148 RepID=UPI00340ABDEE
MSVRRLRAVDLVDVFVYTVVLCAFVQLVPKVISESFLMSLGTAVLMKLVLEGVVKVKSILVGRIKAATRLRGRVGASLGLVAASAGSKALILWLTDVVFGDAVMLGGFFAVTTLVVSLMLARAGVRALLTP